MSPTIGELFRSPTVDEALFYFSCCIKDFLNMPRLLIIFQLIIRLCGRSRARGVINAMLMRRFRQISIERGLAYASVTRKALSS